MTTPRPNANASASATPDAPANGVGRNFAETEVLPLYDTDPRMRIGCVEFSRSSVVNSPCFWILVGVGLAIGAQYFLNSRKN